MKRTITLLLVLTAVIIFTGCGKTTSPLSTDKEITEFIFTNTVPALTGQFDETIINFTVPWGTDVKTLVASFTTTGLEVTVENTAQESGTSANDFSLPITYTVIAEDGTSAEYTVNVYITVNKTQLMDMINANEVVTMADTSGITDMSYLFAGNLSFNQDISGWDVSNVTNMKSLFYDVSSFNQDLSNWDVGEVTDMNSLFYGAAAFNQDISHWDVSKVTLMPSLFFLASSFNQDISGWDVSHVTNMALMFSSASAFNQDISNWTVSNVTEFSGTFYNSTAFNQDISGWDVSNAVNMMTMFHNAEKFNQNLTGWNVSKVTNHASFNGGTSALTDTNCPVFIP